jgi:hypothetical protein
VSVEERLACEHGHDTPPEKRASQEFTTQRFLKEFDIPYIVDEEQEVEKQRKKEKVKALMRGRAGTNSLLSMITDDESKGKVQLSNCGALWRLKRCLTDNHRSLGFKS